MTKKKESKFEPKPVEIEKITISPDHERLVNEIARDLHHRWSFDVIAKGWKYGKEHHDGLKESPVLVAFAQLDPTTSAQYREKAADMLRIIQHFGWVIFKPGRANKPPMSSGVTKGCQVLVGDFSFIMPAAPPDSDQDVIDYEDLVARIERAAMPHKAVVDSGKSAAKQIREMITSEMTSRLVRDDDKEAGLFDEQGPDDKRAA